MSYEPPFKSTAAIEALCLEIAELVGSAMAVSDLPANITLHRELRIQTIYSSLLIEGNRLSQDQAYAVLQGKPVIGNPRDILEVQNAQRAYDNMPTYDPYNLADLLRAHKTMMSGLTNDAGKFRANNVGVFDGENLIHAGTPAVYVSEVMANLFEWLRITTLHPLVASSIFHYEFEFIHPFSDGNGRTGRLWQTVLLSNWRSIFAWTPIESIIRERQSEYYRAFALSENKGSSEPFVEFMLSVIRDALLPFAQSANDNNAENIAINFFKDHPKGTIKELASILGTSRRSAERLVADLKKSNKLSRVGSARNGIWLTN